MNEVVKVCGCVAVLLVALALYFLPTILARKNSYVLKLFFANLLLGWTFFGWVIMFVRAIKKPKPLSETEANILANTEKELKRLQQLYDNGVMNEDEYESQKQKLVGPLGIDTDVKNKKTVRTHAIIIFSCTALLCLALLYCIVPRYVYGAEATARKFLNEMRSNNIEPRIYGSNFIHEVSEENFPKIFDYEILKVKKRDKNRFMVLVNLIGSNKLGEELTREIGLVLEKEQGDYRIVDSYNLIELISRKVIFGDNASDLQKKQAIKNLRNNLNITNWSFTIDTYGAAKGHGLIKNNGNYPVRFIEFGIKYFDENQKQINTDVDYAIDGNELEPGESRSFSWYTPNCRVCKKADIEVSANDDN